MDYVRTWGEFLGGAADRRTLSNHEIVTLAVLLLGGESQYVDTEDVAVRANELAPGRYTWRKYPEQINLELIRVYLSDAKKPKKGAYLLGSGNSGWMLTERGLAFARKSIALLDVTDLSSVALKPRDRQWREGQRVRMLASAAFTKFSTGQKVRGSFILIHAAVRWYSWISPPSRSTRTTAPSP